MCTNPSWILKCQCQFFLGVVLLKVTSNISVRVLLKSVFVLDYESQRKEMTENIECVGPTFSSFAVVSK